MTDLTIRPVSADDLDEIMQHRRCMFADMGYADENAIDRSVVTTRSFLRRCFDQGSYKGWFAIIDGRIAAGVGLLIFPWVAGPRTPEQTHRAYLLNVYTWPEFRRMGLARELTKTAIEWCKAHGFQTLWLHASETGRKVYESLGFQSTNEMMLRL